MSRPSLTVTLSETDVSRIPDLVTEGASLVVDLTQRGKTREVGEKLQIRRQGGYCGLDVWLFLVLFMTSGASVGVRKFWDGIRPMARGLAALGGRKKLMAPASLSRALSAVEAERLRPLGSFLLASVTGIDAVLRHPSTSCLDALGRPWQGYHLDPTVTALRHRALPAGDDLPEPLRDSEETAAAGYSGRKRGDVQFRRVTVQHAGSGAWIHAHLSKGNGEGVVDLRRALDSIAETTLRIGASKERSLVVLDGEYGHVPGITAGREAGLPFITRLNRPALYQDADALRRLRKATWRPVRDSHSGPQRFAADIGRVTLAPAAQTRRPDGTPYAPVEVRLVASIFQKEGDAQRGRVFDGWQVELFVADAPTDAWPASDVVYFYFGRTGQENHFHQEDRELGLDRIVSYHLPGQELAVLVGLSVWNLRIAQGMALEPPPAHPPPQQLRPAAEEGPDLPPAWPPDPVLDRQLQRLDWDALLSKRPGWSFDPATGTVRCEDGRPLVLTSVRPKAHAEGRVGIIFRRPSGGCEDCEARRHCLKSERNLASKHVEFSVPEEVASRIRSRLRAVRVRPASRDAGARAPAPGPLLATPSMFLPARARQGFASLFDFATLHVSVRLPPERPPGPRLVADGPPQRQRRRQTWTETVVRNTLPDGASVHLQVTGSGPLRSWIARGCDSAKSAAGSTG